MNRLFIVLVGAIGIGIGLGVAFLIPSLKDPDTAEANQASVSTALKDDSATSSDEELVEDESEEEFYDVIKVVDGDTIAISLRGKSETIRLIGIDTPETVDSRVAVQCFGKEATAKLKSVIGKRVSIEKDEEEGERDKYGRLLAYIYTEEGLFLNKYMIEQGFAFEYMYDDPYKYQKEFKAAQASAKAAKKGLWAPDACPSAAAKTTTSSVTVSKQESAPAALGPPAQSATSAPQSLQTHTQQVQTQPQSEPQPPQNPPPSPPSPAQTSSTSNYTCSSNTYNCTDFKTHAEAQAVFDMCGGVGNDVHKLDSNKDGEACESLP